MYRFALALALIVAAARPAAALSELCTSEDLCVLGDASTCPAPDRPNCCPFPTGRRRRLNFGKSEPEMGCCLEDCAFFE